MRNLRGSIILLLVMFLLDLYIFQAIKLVTNQSGTRIKWLVYGGYWLVCGLSLAFVALLPVVQLHTLPAWARQYGLALLMGFFLAQVITLPFLITDDLRRLVQWVIATFITKNTEVSSTGAEELRFGRSAFLSWLGLGVGTTLFGTLLYGFRNKYRYQVRRHQLAFANVPQGLKGLRIVQISDIHSGSFTNPEAVRRGVELINDQHPDVILFTGDLVNDRAVEMEPYIGIFSQLKAPMGVFSTFGNHDYGDYAPFPTPEAKAANLKRLAEIHAQMGWRLLMDEHVRLERNGDAIALLGVQNISGKGRFHTYGNLQKAYDGAASLPFKILMSHDPSHWDAEVRTRYPDIDLTLSGHTHGMQFGVELPGFKWSPVKWMYRQWADLYEAGTQKLYVNRGFGFIGYPGRVGILPEITVIELV